MRPKSKRKKVLGSRLPRGGRGASGHGCNADAPGRCPAEGRARVDAWAADYSSLAANAEAQHSLAHERELERRDRPPSGAGEPERNRWGRRRPWGELATNRRSRGQQPSGVALRAQAWHSGPAGNRSLAHALLKLKIAEAREQVGLRDRAKPGQLSASDFSSYGIPSEPVSL